MDIVQLEICGDAMTSALLADPILTIFGVCVWILQVIGEFTGMGYELANIMIFVVIHPAITIMLFILWRRALGRSSRRLSSKPARRSDGAAPVK